MEREQQDFHRGFLAFLRRRLHVRAIDAAGGRKIRNNPRFIECLVVEPDQKQRCDAKRESRTLEDAPAGQKKIGVKKSPGIIFYGAWPRISRVSSPIVIRAIPADTNVPITERAGFVMKNISRSG